MKSTIAKLVADAVASIPELAQAAGELAAESTVERTRDASHGDFASNVAMRLAKPARKNPREIAASIIDALPPSDAVAKTEIAGPGFINFHLAPAAFQSEVLAILDASACYGRMAPREAPKILLEFVSANPTGPLHVGHGRHAALGQLIAMFCRGQHLFNAVGQIGR